MRVAGGVERSSNSSGLLKFWLADTFTEHLTTKGAEKMKKALMIFLGFSLLGTSAWAFVIGGSNFGFGGYPDHYCNQPYKPYDFSSNWEIENYNQELRQYISCIEEYAENAKNDIKRIIDKVDQAIEEANSL